MGGWFLGADGDEDLKIYLLWPKLLKKRTYHKPSKRLCAHSVTQNKLIL